MRRRDRRGGVLPGLALCFGLGIAVGWWLRSEAPMPAIVGGVSSESSLPGENLEAASTPAIVATTGEPLIAAAPRSFSSVIAELRDRDLDLPIDDIDVDSLEGHFAQRRDRGRRAHEAVDILAPRNTPIRAVEDGTIAKLYISKGGGGITIYQFDPGGRFCYYYAHLERYAPGLKEGQPVSRGDILGYVGTTGNAPPNTPHLHFAIFELDEGRQWWKGRPLDPYLVFMD
jgi:murein DD-endopeptidase MepM/ murein hydrolase activator NlpD